MLQPAGGEWMDGMDLGATVPVTFTVYNARSVNSKWLFALVDVEIEIADVSLEIVGVQARREPGNMTSIRLPTFKNANGTWQAAIRLPPEMVGPMGDAVLACLVEEGLAKRRF